MSRAEAAIDSLDRRAAAGVELLRQLLVKQHDLHGRLLEQLNAKREAIRTANLEALTEAGQAEEKIVQQVLALEKQRIEILTRVAHDLQLDAQDVTVAKMSDVLPREVGERLAAAAEGLRERVGLVKERSAMIRQAAEGLNQHLSGIVQTVQRALSQAGVYGRQGRMNPGDQVRSSLDLKT